MSLTPVLPPVQRSRTRHLGLCRLLRGLAAALVLTAPAVVPAASDRDPARWPTPVSPALDPAVEAFVTDLMAKMSLEQKVGQVIQAELRFVTPEDIRRYHLGSVLNGGGSTPNNNKHATAADWVAAADAFYDASMAVPAGLPAIPIIWGSDAVHGHSNVYGATLFPHNIGLGAADDPGLMREIGATTALEMRVTGLDWTFAPTLAVVRDDRWGRTYEGYSEDPRIVGRYAAAIVDGLQGTPGRADYLGKDHIVATAKHFLGDGGTTGGRDQGDNVETEVELVRLHAAGYPPAIAGGVRAIMASFSSWHGDKLHGHRYLLTTVLKERMGFTGFVVGDWNGHGQVKGCSNADCAAAFNAGVDMFMVPEDFAKLYENTLAEVRAGTISQARLDDAVRRILRVKKQSGLFEAGRPSSRAHAGQQAMLGSATHRGLARRAVRESLVLLKNEHGLLPLQPRSRVLVAGPGADDLSRQTGGWTLTWQGTGNVGADFPGATSILAGIRSAVVDAGGSVEWSVDGRYSQRPDVAIVVYGESPYAEFQGDAAHLQYEASNGPDLTLLRTLKAAGIPVVSVFLSGRPLWINPHLNASDAFVAAWLPGSEGAGVADVLFRSSDGRVAHDFRGRLSYSWPRRADQTPLNVGDKVYDPLFAYGYGLSYAAPAAVPTLSEVSGLSDSALAPAGVYFANGRPMAGYVRSVGATVKSLQRVEGLEMFAPGLSPTVEPADRIAQGDASLMRWLPGKPGYLVVAKSGPPLDLERESNGQLSLSLMLRTGPAAKGKVYVGMRDATGHSARVEITPILRSDSTWQQYRIALRCLAEQGLDMRSISAPFELYGEDTTPVGVAEVRLATAAEGDAYCPTN
jgi:beta-glucosidase